MRLLLLDDHAVIRQALHCMLDNVPGIRVVGSAASAADGLAQAVALKPDIVLADYHLQDHDAPWLIRGLAELGESAPVVVLSVHTEEDVVIQCLEAGARGYLPKACSAAELELALNEVCRGETYLHPRVALKAFHRARTKYMDRSARADIVTPREKELLLRVVDGRSNQAIADELHLSLSTVKAHLRSVFRKLEVEDRTQALVEAFRRGILTQEDLCGEVTSAGGNF